MKDLEPKIVFSEVNTNVDYALEERFDIKYIPSMLIFKDSRPVNLELGNTADDIIRMIKKRTEFNVNQINQKDEFLALLEKEEMVAIIFTKVTTYKCSSIFKVLLLTFLDLCLRYQKSTANLLIKTY